jgi:hypothetical protein
MWHQYGYLPYLHTHIPYWYHKNTVCLSMIEPSTGKYRNAPYCAHFLLINHLHGKPFSIWESKSEEYARNMDIQLTIFPAFRQTRKPDNQRTSKMEIQFTRIMAICLSVFLYFCIYGLPYFQETRITVLHISIFLVIEIQMSIMSRVLLLDVPHIHH